MWKEIKMWTKYLLLVLMKEVRVGWWGDTSSPLTDWGVTILTIVIPFKLYKMSHGLGWKGPINLTLSMAWVCPFSNVGSYLVSVHQDPWIWLSMQEGNMHSFGLHFTKYKLKTCQAFKKFIHFEHFCIFKLFPQYSVENSAGFCTTKRWKLSAYLSIGLLH